MANRTPSFLHWLIDKRARLHGDLLNYERILARHIKKADKEIEKINQALSRAPLMLRLSGGRTRVDVLGEIVDFVQLRT